MRKRKQNTRKLKPRFYIFSEGEKTEYNYFSSLISDLGYNRSKQVDIKSYKTKGKDALKLIREALSESPTESDKFWIVIDKDFFTGHDKVFELKDSQRKKGKNIDIAFSSICFEEWILMHFEYTGRAFASCNDLIRYLQRKNYIANYNKADKNIYELIKDRIETAKENAERLNRNSLENNPGKRIFELNPYTNIHELLKDLEDFYNKHVKT